MAKTVWIKRLVVPLLAVLTVSAVVFLLLFTLVSQRERVLHDQSLRTLAMLGDQLTRRLARIASVAENYPSRKDAPSETRRSPKYLQEHASDLQWFDPDRPQSLCPSYTKAVHELLVSSPVLWIQTDHAAHHFGVTAINKDDLQPICLKSSIDDTIAPLVDALAKDAFDELVLIEGSGRVIYQTKDSAIRATDLPSAWLSANTSSPQATVPFAQVDATRFSSIPLAGTNYNVYLNPVDVASFSPGAQQANRVDITRPQRLALVGFLRSSELRQRALTPFLPVLFWSALLLLVILFGYWPLMKFRTMRHTDRIPSYAAVLLLVLAMITVSLVTLGILQFGYSDFVGELSRSASAHDDVEQSPRRTRPIDTTTRRRLEKLSSDIQKNVSAEVRSALGGLAWATEARESDPLQDESAFSIPGEPMILSTRPGIYAQYPYFEQIFWVDADGKQTTKWTIRGSNTRQTPVSSFPFFREIRDNHTWSFRSDPARRFRIDALQSPTTGTYTAVIAAPPASASLTGSRKPTSAMAVMVTQLISLIDVVMPQDFGFAVVDQSGRVLFHSTSARNQSENLLNEVDRNEALRAAIASRFETYIPRVLYHGVLHGLYVAPFSEMSLCDWRLVTFRDLTAATARRDERVIIFLVLAGFYFALCLLVCGVLWRRRLYPAGAWPTPDRIGAYWQVTLAAMVFIGAALYYILFMARPGHVLWASLSMGPAAVSLFAVKLARGRRQVPILPLVSFAVLALTAVDPAAFWLILLTALAVALLGWAGLEARLQRLAERRADSLASAYALAATATIVLMSWAPSIGFFKLAYEYQNLQSLKRDELLTLGALEARARRVAAQYRDVRFATSQPQSFDTMRALFLERRLIENRWDRYDGMIDQKLEFTATGQSEWQRFDSIATAVDTWIPNPAATLQRQVARGHCTEGDWGWVWMQQDMVGLSSSANPDETCAGTPEQSPERQSKGAMQPSEAFAQFASKDTLYRPGLLVGRFELFGLERDNAWGLLGFLITNACVLYALFYWLRHTANRLFLLDARLPPRPLTVSLTSLPEDLQTLRKARHLTATRRHAMVVGHPLTGKSRRLTERLPADARCVDVADLVRSGTCEAMTGWFEGLLIIDNFDCGAGDVTADALKLQLLESVVFQESITVVLVTSVDQTFDWKSRLGPGAAPLRVEDAAWERVWATFAEPVFDRDSVPAESDFHRMLIWRASTPSERVALSQLALDGWANFKNRSAVEHLYFRGLVQAGPPRIRIAADSFQGFVSRDEQQREVMPFLAGLDEQPWYERNVTLFAVLAVALGVVLWFAQQQTLAVLSGVLSALATIARFSADLRGVGRAASSKD